MQTGDRLTLSIERPAAGGRMIARHQGAVVLVSGAIPGERVEAQVEQVRSGTGWARTATVLEASADRVERDWDTSCGGSVFAHIQYPRQLSLKVEILQDALRRIGRLRDLPDIAIEASPTLAYRMRARLHLRHGRLGFFREHTHELCDAALTGQLLEATTDVLVRLASALYQEAHLQSAEIEVSENCAATERAVHLELDRGTDPSRIGCLGRTAGVTGLSYHVRGSSRVHVLHGSPHVEDTLSVSSADGPIPFAVRRHVRSFFQANRFLLADLVRAVVAHVPPGDAIDLYAGVGLFALALGARGDGRIAAVEGDRAAADDLTGNAAASSRVSVHRESVEGFVHRLPHPTDATLIVDPPRSGMSAHALSAIMGLGAPRIVYVSCDVATLARDARALVSGGYALRQLRAFDLFPNTAHVESMAVFDRLVAPG
ncbi:MAG: class I SAM-dependent RNA methyltransferase [Acidobacteriota bacterium]